MANIQSNLNKIKNAFLGIEVRDSIHDAIKQCYDDASAKDNANMEVKMARGEYENLGKRLDSHSSQIKDKANKNEVIKKGNVTLDDCTEDVLNAIQGGEGTSFELLSIPRDGSVTPAKTNFVTYVENLLNTNDITEGKVYGWDSNGIYQVENQTNNYIVNTPIFLRSGITYYFKEARGKFCCIVKKDKTTFLQKLSDADSKFTGTFTPTEDCYLYYSGFLSTATIDRKITNTDYYVENQLDYGDYYDIKIFGYDLNEFNNINFRIDNIDKILSFFEISIQYLKMNIDDDGSYYTGVDSKAVADGYHAYPPIELNPGTYTIKSRLFFSFIKYNDGTSQRLSTDSKYSGNNGTINITLNQKATLYITGHMSTKTDDYYAMIVNDKELPEIYQEDIYAINVKTKDSKKINKITVKKDGTGDFSTVVEAVNSIKDSSENNQYTIEIYSGEYDIIEELGGDSYLSKVENDEFNFGERNGLRLPDYVHLKGIGNVILKAKIEDSKATLNLTTRISTLNIWMNNDIENLTILAKNTRYAIHDETNNMFNNLNRTIKNCKIIHEGNKADMWASTQAYAAGTGGGGNYEFINSSFISIGSQGWSMHNNENQYGNNVLIDGCYVKGKSGTDSIRLYYFKQNTEQGNFYIKNTIYDSMLVRAQSESIPSTNVWNVYNYVENTVTPSELNS